MSRNTNNFLQEGWLQHAVTSVLYRSEREWAAIPEAQKSAHFMRRAWEKLGLEAILTVEGRPTVPAYPVGCQAGQTQRREACRETQRRPLGKPSRPLRLCV